MSRFKRPRCWRLLGSSTNKAGALRERAPAFQFWRRRGERALAARRRSGSRKPRSRAEWASRAIRSIGGKWACIRFRQWPSFSCNVSSGSRRKCMRWTTEQPTEPVQGQHERLVGNSSRVRFLEADADASTFGFVLWTRHLAMSTIHSANGPDRSRLRTKPAGISLPWS
jgi:hypothetical protein